MSKTKLKQAGAGNEKKDRAWLFEQINAPGKRLRLWALSPENAVSLWK